MYNYLVWLKENRPNSWPPYSFGVTKQQITHGGLSKLSSRAYQRGRMWLDLIAMVGIIAVSILATTLLIQYLFGGGYIWPFGDFGEDDRDEIGAFIGGVATPILSLVTVGLVFLTYRSQQRELKQTGFTLGLQQFENAFFEMLKVHRDNVADIEYKDARGRSAFVPILKRCKDLLGTITRNTLAGKLPLYQRLELAYLIMFWGKGRMKEFNHPVLSGRYSIEADSWPLLKTQLSSMGIPGQGLSSYLGNYFRHLFQTVRFVDEHPIFNSWDKDYSVRYEYVKKLRAQLSDYELGVFFLGSLPHLGEDWEWKWAKQNPRVQEGIIAERALITRYRLLKNIPPNIIQGVNPLAFYPDIKYVGYDKKYRNVNPNYNTDIN